MSFKASLSNVWVSSFDRDSPMWGSCDIGTLTAATQDGTDKVSQIPTGKSDALHSGGMCRRHVAFLLADKHAARCIEFPGAIKSAPCAGLRGSPARIGRH